MPQVSRDLFVQTLEEIALLMELKGENPFKTRAYRNGAEIVQNFDGDIVAKAFSDDLKGIKGIGDALQQKLHELATTGKLEFHENLRKEFPESLFDLFDLQGLGPKKIKLLYDLLGVSSVESLEAACQSGQIEALPGFGKKSVEKILKAIEDYRAFASRFRLGDIAPLAEHILAELKEHPETLRAEIAGSYRRAKETLHDLDFLVATRSPTEVIRFFCELPEGQDVISQGSTKAAIRLENGLQCDLRAVTNEQFPFALQYFSGSKEHNISIRGIALKKGLSLNEYGFSGEGDIPEVHEESDIYRALGMEAIPPELRENRGEVEAAQKSILPPLIQQGQLKGTFHNHTTASDGRHTLTEMAEAAEDLGLDYLGISDHSKSSFQANGLDEERLARQIEEVRAFNDNKPPLRIFAGSEVDILKDGSLDFDDTLLQQLDYCVASVHSSFQLEEAEMTRRIIRAMENEHVTMIGHLTGRILLRRDPYALNIEKIIDCAAETKTIIELNCSPRRLDMDWRWWKRASEKGVLTSINPDAHDVSHFQFLAFGVRVARKGWLEPKDVLNTRSVPEVEKWLQTPKAKR